MEKHRDLLEKLLVAAGGALLGAAGAYLVLRRSEVPEEVAACHQIHHTHSVEDRARLEKLMREQLVRNYQYFGEEGQEKIRKAFVVVVGCGGVGSHVVSALVRGGISRIRVIDFDMVTVSSLNRSAFAYRKDVGRPKACILQEYLPQLNPLIELETVQDFFSKKNEAEMLKGSPDLVIDCIDDIDTKVELIRYCVEQGIAIISSGGAGTKGDPTKVQIRDISETNCTCC